jgi:cell division protein FtsB
MHRLAWVLSGLILLLQYPLWLGKGSWLRVWELERRISDQRQANGALIERNNQLAAEVKDLKTGYEALEARARYELGMIKGNEIFYQVMDPPHQGDKARLGEFDQKEAKP